MIILEFLGMCLLEFVIGKIFDTVTESVIEEGIHTLQIPRLGAPFVGALR